MYHRLVTKYPELKSSSRLAIISPYRYQVKLFRDKYKETFGVASEKFVDINTVDGFQVKYLYMFLFKSLFYHYVIYLYMTSFFKIVDATDLDFIKKLILSRMF